MAVPGSGSEQAVGGTEGVASGASVRLPIGQGDTAIVLPSASHISDNAFHRVGADLKVVGSDGNEVVVEGYFVADPTPDLASPDGAQLLSPALLESFLLPMAPGQYAQAAPVSVTAPIGQVLDLQGEAVAVRADGSRIQLAKGDSVYEGDVIETGGGESAIRMVFTDETEFSLGTDARLALDQLVFNPDTQSGSAQFSVLKGVFIFASGQIAKSDNTDMTVTTPVATIGIRGTEVAGRVANGDSQFTIIDGAIEVTTRAGSVTLDANGETTMVSGNDAAPSDPVVLSPAQFGQAYGDVSGVVSSYFGPAQPGTPGTAPGGGGSAPAGPGGGQDSPAPSTDDRAEAGTAGGTLLASTLPADTPVVGGTSDPMTLASAFVSDPTTSVPDQGGAPFSAVTSGPAGIAGDGLLASGAAGQIPSGSLGVSGAGVPSGFEGGSAPEPDADEVISIVPGIGLAENITFGAPAAPGGGVTGFDLGPSGANVAPGTSGAGPETVQVSFSDTGSNPGVPAPLTVPDVSPDLPSSTSGGSAPLDMPSTGSSGSPFRSESGGATDPFAGNPYVSQPFGYAGPQIGDAIFNLAAGEVSNDSVDSSIIVDDDPNTAGVASAAPETSAAPAPATQAFEVSLVVSNATSSGQFQNLTDSYTLPNLGAGSSALISGAEMNLPGVADSVQVALNRDGGGNVDVKLNTAWDSLKNIRAESDTAGDLRVENFVHADVHFGGSGDSNITFADVKRGFVTTGEGNDSITIDAKSNGGVWSNLFDLRTGAGNDTVTLDGAPNGLTELHFDGGAGIDTVHLTGPGQSFDLGGSQITLEGVERIDISGAGDVTLTIPSNLFAGSGSFFNVLTNSADTLVVDGDAGDTVDLVGSSWAQVDTAEIDGESYTIFEHSDGMRVAADADLQVV